MNSLKIAQAAVKLRQWRPAVCLQQQHRFMSKKMDASSSSLKGRRPHSEAEVDNEPIQYFGSQAASWRAKDTRSGGSEDHLSYQPYVISASLAIFLLYFCVLREESDIDRKLEGSLYDHVEGLEEMQLVTYYKYNKENGLDNGEVVKRLSELGIDVKLLETKLVESN